MNDIAQMLEHPEATSARNHNSANSKLMNIGFIGLGQWGPGWQPICSRRVIG